MRWAAWAKRLTGTGDDLADDVDAHAHAVPSGWEERTQHGGRTVDAEKERDGVSDPVHLRCGNGEPGLKGLGGNSFEGDLGGLVRPLCAFGEFRRRCDDHRQVRLSASDVVEWDR